MESAVELGATTLSHIAENHGERIYERLTGHRPSRSSASATNDQNNTDDRRSHLSRREHRPRRYRTELPSPERDNEGDRELEAQSETSEQVLRAYENEQDDPKRRPSDVLGNSRSLRGSRRSDKMSYANGYSSQQRPLSQQPPRLRRGDDEDDDGSDYDERSGRRYRTTGKGYDPDRDREYDREVIETERYRGPPRDWAAQRSPSHNDAYAAQQYAVEKYNRSPNDLAPYDSKRRSRSRGRRDDRYYEDERERSHSREHEGIREKVGEFFDTTPQGLGVGLAGAVVGGLAARQFGDKRNSKRDMLLGAVIGGLGANAAENKYRDWRDERKDKLEREEDRYEQRIDGRSRSAMR